MPTNRNQSNVRLIQGSFAEIHKTHPLPMSLRWDFVDRDSVSFRTAVRAAYNNPDHHSLYPNSLIS